jgi:hypothetical protein
MHCGRGVSHVQPILPPVPALAAFCDNAREPSSDAQEEELDG